MSNWMELSWVKWQVKGSGQSMGLNSHTGAVAACPGAASMMMLPSISGWVASSLSSKRQRPPVLFWTTRPTLAFTVFWGAKVNWYLQGAGSNLAGGVSLHLLGQGSRALQRW